MLVVDQLLYYAVFVILDEVHRHFIQNGFDFIYNSQ